MIGKNDRERFCAPASMEAAGSLTPALEGAPSSGAHPCRTQRPSGGEAAQVQRQAGTRAEGRPAQDRAR